MGARLATWWDRFTTAPDHVQAAAPTRRALPAASLTPSVAVAGARTAAVRPFLGTIFGRDMNTLADLTVDPGLLAGAWLWNRDAAMSVPTISRARDLICSLVGSLPITVWNVGWDDATNAEVLTPLRPYPWCHRPDPNRTRGYLLAWLTDDLMFRGVAYLRVTARYAPAMPGVVGYPSAFEWMPAAEVDVPDDGSVVRWSPSLPGAPQVELDPVDVVEILSPLSGLLATAGRAVGTAIELDQAAAKYARMDVPAGWLEQTEGAPLSATELADAAASFAAARQIQTVGAVGLGFSYHEASMDPDRMQLTGSRQYQALELARHANVPPYLVGAPTGTGMTYQNAQQARSDLVSYGAMPYINALEQTLSGPNVVPATQRVLLDLTEWLRDPTAPPQPRPADQPPNVAVPTTNPPATPSTPDDAPPDGEVPA